MASVASSGITEAGGGVGRRRCPFVIGVAGGTASGKTTVCDAIIQRLHDQCVVMLNQDSFYRPLTEVCGWKWNAKGNGGGRGGVGSGEGRGGGGRERGKVHGYVDGGTQGVRVTLNADWVDEHVAGRLCRPITSVGKERWVGKDWWERTAVLSFVVGVAEGRASRSC